MSKVYSKPELSVTVFSSVTDVNAINLTVSAQTGNALGNMPKIKRSTILKQ